MPLDIPSRGVDLGARIFQNTTVLIGGRGVSIALSAGAAALLARYLGSEQLGQYGAIYAYVSLFGWLATFGLESILTREASREREFAGSILWTGIMLCAAFSLVAMLLMLVAAPHAGYRGYLFLLLAIASVETLVAPLRIPGVVFQVDLRQWYGVGINAFRQATWLGVIVVLAFAHASLVFVVLGRLATALLEALLIWYASFRFVSGARNVLRERVGPLLRGAFPIAFSTLLACVYMRIDQVMLHNMSTDFVLGHYVAAVKISELFETVPSALISSLFPVLAVSVATQGQFQAYISRAFRYLSVFAAGLCVCVTLSATLIVRVIYGQQFAASARLLQVLIWSEVSIFFGTLVASALVAANLQKYLMLPTGVGAVANVLLNLVLIPRYAAVGAAWATVVSYSLAWTVALLPCQRARAIVLEGLKSAIPVVGMALLALGLTSVLPVPDPLRILAGLFAFVAGVWLIRIIGPDDIGFARATLVRSLSALS